MAYSVVGSDHEAPGGLISLNCPVGVAAGDYLVALVAYFTNSNPISAPTGWTAVDQRSTTDFSVGLFERVAGSSEPASWTFHTSNDATLTGSSGVLVAFRGTATSSPRDGAAVRTDSGVGALTHTTGTYTPSQSGDLLIGGFFGGGGATWSCADPYTLADTVAYSAGIGVGIVWRTYDAIDPTTVTADSSVSTGGSSWILGVKGAGPSTATATAPAAVALRESGRTATAPATVALSAAEAHATLGTPVIDVTFENLALEIPYTPAEGYDGSDLTATIQYRPWGSSEDYRTALPPQNLWHDPTWDVVHKSSDQYFWDDGPTAFYGSILSCAAGSNWEIQVTVTDGDANTLTWGNATDGCTVRSVAGTVSAPANTAITTRAEDIADAATLPATHYVAPSGSDGNDGSAAHPWQTLDHAIAVANAAAAAMVIEFAAGTYALTSRLLTGNGYAVTLRAQYPAVEPDADGLPVAANSGLRSIIASPNGTAPGDAAWTAHTMTGPNGGSYTCWKAVLDLPANGDGYGLNQLSVAKDTSSLPRELLRWDRKAGTSTTTDGTKTYSLTTPAAWLEALSVNLTYRYGFAVWAEDGDSAVAGDGLGLGRYCYLVMPSLPRADGSLSADPNDFVVNYGIADTQRGFGQLRYNGPDLRCAGFELRHVAVVASPASDRLILDRCLLANASLCVYAAAGEGGYPAPSTYPQDAVIQDCIVTYTTCKAGDPEAPEAAGLVPWSFVKQAVLLPDSPSGSMASPWDKIGGSSEAGGEAMGILLQGGSRRGVVRRNRIAGPFDGIGTGDNQQLDRYANYAMDITDNVISLLHDDGLVPAQKQINMRFCRNAISYSLTGMSSSYTNAGPIFFVRNTFWRVGFLLAPPAVDGSLGGAPDVTKYGDYVALAPALTYLVHNTIWTDDPRGASGGAEDTTSDPAAPQWFVLRGNIYRTSADVWNPPAWAPSGGWDEDGDLFVSDYATTHAGDTTHAGIRVGGVTQHTLAGYRTASGDANGAATNQLPGTTTDFSSATTLAAVDAVWVDPANGDLRLAVPLPYAPAMPGITGYTLDGLAYTGTLPDLGAIVYAAGVGSTATATAAVALSAPGQTASASGAVALRAIDQTATATAAVALSLEGTTGTATAVGRVALAAASGTGTATASATAAVALVAAGQASTAARVALVAAAWPPGRGPTTTTQRRGARLTTTKR